MHTRTIVCIVCECAFSSEYTGGRDRRTCDDRACKRARKATNKRRERGTKTERPDGYCPADYPVNTPDVLPKAELRALIETTRYHRARKRLRAQPDGVEVDRRCATDSVEATIGEIVESGHGYYMDDVRPRDDAPLRLIEPKHRCAVKYWFRDAGFPIAGFRVDVTRGDYPVTRVRGRVDNDVCTGEFPRRITRHWCSATALVPLEPFVSLFPCTSEGRTAA